MDLKTCGIDNQIVFKDGFPKIKNKIFEKKYLHKININDPYISPLDKYCVPYVDEEKLIKEINEFDYYIPLFLTKCLIENHKINSDYVVKN